ncbi:hypothetical protein ACWPKS_02875 [Coraliomargarita sp. W4R72]
MPPPTPPVQHAAALVAGHGKGEPHSESTPSEANAVAINVECF